MPTYAFTNVYMFLRLRKCTYVSSAQFLVTNIMFQNLAELVAFFLLNSKHFCVLYGKDYYSNYLFRFWFYVQ